MGTTSRSPDQTKSLSRGPVFRALFSPEYFPCCGRCVTARRNEHTLFTSTMSNRLPGGDPRCRERRMGTGFGGLMAGGDWRSTLHGQHQYRTRNYRNCSRRRIAFSEQSKRRQSSATSSPHSARWWSNKMRRHQQRCGEDVGLLLGGAAGQRAGPARSALSRDRRSRRGRRASAGRSGAAPSGRARGRS